VSGSGPLQPHGLLTHPDVQTWLSGHANVGDRHGLDRVPLQAAGVLPQSRNVADERHHAGSPFVSSQTSLGSRSGSRRSRSASPKRCSAAPCWKFRTCRTLPRMPTAILFGDFKTAYRIADRVELSTLVNPYTLATKGATRIHATRRVGGEVVQPKAIVKLKIATA